MSKPIYILNGPNLNLLGKRNPDVYGNITFETFLIELRNAFPDIDIQHFQSNHEGELIDKLHNIGFSDVGIIFNPGGYTHTSIALRDAVESIEAPVIEVHISDIYSREDFRQMSYIKDVADLQICGFGLAGYKMAIEYFIKNSK